MNNYEDYIKEYIDIFETKKYIQFLDNNMIIYGPKGIGKYSFVLNLIKNRSNSELTLLTKRWKYNLIKTIP